ncbi:hypothetical protein SAMN05421874_112148 [Nonomuraea maritima]|uniref:Chitinase n=1 Tax=Nonomuraea maritima TaxID=683260 RepID=A0A1G9FKP8_9ACTN|nr:hypothetical protein [Nonomuraea maritima]SDK88956.1 hypothetical protein SAMN05421874_112148 [Nonomuraea maritima]
MLPRPLAVLAAFSLAVGTAVAVRLLPADAARPVAVATRPAVSPSPPVVPPPAPPPAFVRFVDLARDPGFDLSGDARRTGTRHYALGHLVAGGDGCAPRWAGGDRGADPVSGRVGRLRALGGVAVPVFGGPDGQELAAACARPSALAAAYLRAIGALEAGAVEFELRDGADRAVALRRARVLRALQHERPLRVVFTLPLRTDGLDPAHVSALRLTRRTGAEVTTVNLLAPVEPRTAREGRLRRMAVAIRAARDQIAEAQGLADPEDAWSRIALTPVVAAAGDLSRADARTLRSYADRHGLAWLSLRGTTSAAVLSDLRD